MAGFPPGPYDNFDDYYYYPPPPPPQARPFRHPSPAPAQHHHRHNHAWLNPEVDMWGNGLHRSRSQGHSPVPQVTIQQDIIQDTMQRGNSHYHSPSPTHSDRSSRRGRRSLVEEAELLAARDELAMERVRSRSRGRSDAAWYELERVRETEKLHQELELARLRDEQAGRAEEDRINAAMAKIKERDAKEKKEKDMAIEEWKMKQDKARRDAEEHDREMKARFKREEEEQREKARKQYEDFKREEDEKKDKAKKQYEEFKAQEKREKEAKEEREKKAYEEFKLKEELEKKRKEERAKEEEKKAENLMVERMRKAGLSEEAIDQALHPKEHKKKTKVTHTINFQQPTYPKVHKDYLSVDTLIYYNLPYEYDRSDPNYIIILREMDRHETEVLFEHTRRHRSKKLLLESKKPEKKYAWVKHKSRSPTERDVKVMEIVRR